MGVGALGLGAGHADHALMLVACDEVAQAPQALTMLQLRLRALGVRVTVLRQDLQMVFAQLQSSEVRQPREESRRSTEFHWERLEERLRNLEHSINGDFNRQIHNLESDMHALQENFSRMKRL